MLDQKSRQQLATRYQLQILTLSPIHIGSGAPDLMMVAAEVIPNGHGRLIVVDPRKLSPPWLTENEVNDLISDRRSLRHLLQTMDASRLEKIAAYQLAQPPERVKSIRQHIKTHHHEPYLPGSSLKGAIRTALAWAIYQGVDIQAGVNYVPDGTGGFKDTEADDLLEAEIFRPGGDDANHDILRALQIADSSSTKGLALIQVGVYSTRGVGLSAKPFRLHVESILPDRQLTASARLDRYLLETPSAEKALRLDVRRSYLENFVSHANDFAESLIEHELAFFTQFKAPPVLEFYESLKGMVQEARGMKDTCLLYLGWGPGWTAKTLGSALDEDTIVKVRQNFNRMGARGVALFPKSRRLMEVDKDQPLRPLGWLALSFKEVK